jgi:hypothetical protein
MSEAPKTPDPSARSPLAGCTILIVCVCVMIFLVGFSTWVLFRQADEIMKFTSDKPTPVKLEVIESRESDVNSLSERLETFRQSLDREDATAFELSPADLNLAIASLPSLSEFRETFHVREIREDGKIVLDVSLRLNGKPRRTREGESGFMTSDPRYLNGTLLVRPELAQQEVILRIDSIEVPGSTVPPQFREQMSPYRITERYKTDPVIGGAMKKLTGLTVTDGKIILRKNPGELAPDTVSAEDVDSAAGRLFKWLGIAACVFLAFVAFVLFIGIRARRRKEQASKGQN